MELYNRYRFTYEVLIVAILHYILELVPSQLLEHRIDEDLTILNGLKETDAQFRTMLDMERTPDGNYKFAKPNHINAVIGVLKESLGTTWEHIIGENRKKSSPFGGAVPWKQVLKVSSGEQGPARNEFIDYIDHQLSNPPDSLHQP